MTAAFIMMREMFYAANQKNKLLKDKIITCFIDRL